MTGDTFATFAPVQDAAYPSVADAQRMTRTWLREIESWTLWMRSAARSEATQYLRVYHVRRLAAAHPHLEPAQVDVDVLVAWLARHEWAPETRRSHRASLRQFYSWMHVTGRITVNPAAALLAVTPPRSKPRPAPGSVYRLALLRADERVELMIRVAGLTGMRRGEIARIHTRDLTDDAHGWSLRVAGKGGHERIIPLDEDLAERLLARPRGWLFPGQIDGHLSPSHVGKLMSRVLGEGWTAHTLRHRFATRAYAADRDIRAVQELLGHASVKTTQIYTLVPDGALRAAVRAAA